MRSTGGARRRVSRVNFRNSKKREYSGPVADPSILPSQFFTKPRRETDGLTRLMMAVLEDGVRTCIRCAGRRDRNALGQLREVLYWLERDDSQGVFSFQNICEVVELDAATLRRRLYEMCKLNPTAARVGLSARRMAVRSRVAGARPAP